MSFRWGEAELGVVVRRRRLAAVVLASTLALAACGGGDGEPSAVTVAESTSKTVAATATTGSTTTTTSSVEAAVEQAFYEQWDAFIEILSDPDPANPLIDRYFTGAAKERVLDLISEYVREQKVARLPEDDRLFDPRVQRIDVVDKHQVVLTECTIDGSVQVERGTGRVLDASISRLHFRNVFVLDGGSWKVSETVTANEDDAPCPFD